MNYNLVADSCCDMTPELQKELNITLVPLKMILDGVEHVDHPALDIPAFMSEMASSKKISTACPSPAAYRDAYKDNTSSFVVTLSKNLSGSYESAVLAKSMAEEERGADVHVFDSKSASAGEVLVALKIREAIELGLSKTEIIARVQRFIDGMKTYFVLGSVDNMMKNGRLNRIVGKIVSVLNIKPLMGSDGDGQIALFSQARGSIQIVEKMTDTIEASGKNTEGETVVITHCNNGTLAQQLTESIRARYRFGAIRVFPTRGLSSLYASDKGIVMAF